MTMCHPIPAKGSQTTESLPTTSTKSVFDCDCDHLDQSNLLVSQIASSSLIDTRHKIDPVRNRAGAHDPADSCSPESRSLSTLET